ncbi:hypothetical protein SAMN05444410_10846 [Hydrobacter penzbergensis]|uniref:Uncharacterized protein n=1 Tax=Hydrobacter penzbergensis TaxID=1235997 RepID=A0A8X8IFU8_9BACT|nr:hypothetical protein [Hydrobacter penzbergensis]SDX01772.1 hypothetical protein SAMN05444410_10846 [Hydrobacter penzbergensis]
MTTVANTNDSSQPVSGTLILGLGERQEITRLFQSKFLIKNATTPRHNPHQFSLFIEMSHPDGQFRTFSIILGDKAYLTGDCKTVGLNLLEGINPIIKNGYGQVYITLTISGKMENEDDVVCVIVYEAT